MTSKMAEGETNKSTIDMVQVALRIRPLMRNEIKRGYDECIEVVPGEQQVQIKDLSFTYNYVFPQHITQEEFYDTAVKRLIEKLFQGYNVTILAYGQTGSGKTYTMGTNYSGSDDDSTKLGVIPRAVADIFDFIKLHEDEFIFKVNISFMELYQEQCYDLLSGKERNHSIIEIREDANKGVILPGITELPVLSINETMMVLERGSRRRATGSTAMNQASSRSHAVFTIAIAKESRTDKNLATTSKFHLVDLAGSERIKKTKACGERMKEGVKINQGLLALGNVISALGDGTNKSFVSYRDSKLTRLLQDSLGGNSLALMVACVSAADYNLHETVSTLRYADRARRIRNKPVVNQDAKTAEILRLNTLVNELRLQLLDKPTVNNCDKQNNKQLQEELEQFKAKYATLLKKHKQFTKHLENVLTENTNLCEKALLAEAARDEVERKLNELTEQCNQTIENLNMTEPTQDDNQKRSSVVDYLKEVKSRLEELQSINLKTNEELIDHEIQLSFVKEDGDGQKVEDDVLLNEDQVVMEEETRAMFQVQLNQKLHELNHAMAVKASVVQTMLANNKEMLDSHNNLKEIEEKISKLEKEKYELLEQLKQTKSKDPSHDERRDKVSTLESEISALRKKCQQQALIIKMKEKNEDTIASLNADLQAMKSNRVNLIRRMREESEKFRKWKADSERAMQRLRTEERKHASAMAKMESLHAKQQNVLKRKMEHTLVVNRRLKEALERHEQSTMKRNGKGKLNTGAVQQYIEQELELRLSVVEAEKSLEELMEYRAWITEQIENLRSSPDDEANRKKIDELEVDLSLRKAQISDLQQKILTADRENKTRIQWDNIQSMLEAKAALKCLFELLVDSKREIQLQNQSEKGYQARYEEMKQSYDRLMVEFENGKTEFETKLASMRMQNERKLSELVALQWRSAVWRSAVWRGRGDRDRDEECKLLQNIIQSQTERLEQLEQENKKMADELEELRNASKKWSQKETVDTLKMVEYHDEFEDTPIFKHIQTQLACLAIKSPPADTVSDAAGAGGHCSCRGSGRGCGGSCRYPPAVCKNRPRVSSDTDDEEDNPSSTEHSPN